MCESLSCNYIQTEHLQDRLFFLRNEELNDVVHELLANHHNHQLDGKLKEAARSVTIVKSKSRKVSISSSSSLSKISRMLKKPSLKVNFFNSELFGIHLQP
jgi:hypothetical protein